MFACVQNAKLVSVTGMAQVLTQPMPTEVSLMVKACLPMCTQNAKVISIHMFYRCLHICCLSDLKHLPVCVQNAKFAEGVTGVVQVLTQPTLSQVQRRCQEMAGWRG